MTKTLTALSACLLMTGCATAPARDGEVLGTAELRQANGQPAGTASLLTVGDAVVVDLAVSGVPAGTRAFHLHTAGQCTPPTFESAGGHLNPYNRDHGLADPDGAHLGDLPNITIEPTGVTRTRLNLTGTRDELLRQIFDADGTSAMIHIRADDNVTDPSGNAGDRIACGVMRRS